MFIVTTVHKTFKLSYTYKKAKKQTERDGIRTRALREHSISSAAY